jgi:hypothetical protein
MAYPNGEPTSDELAEKATFLLQEAADAPSDADGMNVIALAGIGFALLAIHDDLDSMRRARI